MTLGYRFDKWLPHLTWSWVEITQDTQVGGVDVDGSDQTSWIFGLRYDALPGVALKAEYVAVETDGQNFPGLFQGTGIPQEANADIIRFAIDYVF